MQMRAFSMCNSSQIVFLINVIRQMCTFLSIYPSYNSLTWLVFPLSWHMVLFCWVTLSFLCYYVYHKWDTSLSLIISVCSWCHIIPLKSNDLLYVWTLWYHIKFDVTSNQKSTFFFCHNVIFSVTVIFVLFQSEK